MATFERHVDVDWQGSVMEGKGEAKAGHRRVLAAGDVSVAHRRAGGQDEPRGADGGGACGVLRDGAERHARPRHGVGRSHGRPRDARPTRATPDQDRRRRS